MLTCITLYKFQNTMPTCTNRDYFSIFTFKEQTNQTAPTVQTTGSHTGTAVTVILTKIIRQLIWKSVSYIFHAAAPDMYFVFV